MEDHQAVLNRGVLQGVGFCMAKCARWLVRSDAARRHFVLETLLSLLCFGVLVPSGLPTTWWKQAHTALCRRTGDAAAAWFAALHCPHRAPPLYFTRHGETARG